MSTRVDALETSIQDIINGDAGQPVNLGLGTSGGTSSPLAGSVPQSPALPNMPGMRRAGSGF
jgi:hypothetical protein